MADNWRSAGGYYQRPWLLGGRAALTARYGAYTKEGAALVGCRALQQIRTLL